mmetsp:Transcript_55906/g.103473  ORF Transcript_55906/g.103473 Transcript_55906/m.103473 type:complete len:112 (+) Transcript_55906:120-455(+)
MADVLVGSYFGALSRRFVVAKDHYKLLGLAVAFLLIRAFIPSVVGTALTVDALECIEELLSFAYITALMVLFDRCSWSRGWKRAPLRPPSDSEQADVRSSTSTLAVLLACL